MDAGTWIIVGASRGIGLELVKQLLQAGQHVIAAVRNVSAAPKLFDLISSQNAGEKCTVQQCDISSDESIAASCFSYANTLEDSTQAYV
jgi:NAD(P)-dependent dehydrogenase (short-subunit alcohol dehydrogenase family)